MNIWSLYKHDNIKLVLLQAQMQLGTEGYQIIDSEDDYQGVYLNAARQRGLRAYLHVYGQSKDHYGLHLEYPFFNENNAADELQIHEHLTLDQAIDALAVHFDLPRCTQAGQCHYKLCRSCRCL